MNKYQNRTVKLSPSGESHSDWSEGRPTDSLAVFLNDRLENNPDSTVLLRDPRTYVATEWRAVPAVCPTCGQKR